MKYQCSTILAIALLFVAILSGCQNDGLDNSKIEFVKPDEAQELTTETGFLYIRSGLDSDRTDGKKILKEIKHIAKEQEINVAIYDELKYKKWAKDDLGIDLYSQSLGFFESGKKKGEVRLSRVDSRENMQDQIKKFIKEIKRDSR